mgnify:FL=1
MVVVAIIALFTTMVIPGVSSYFQISLNSAAREMATVIKETYNSTIMTGRIHRIVFDIKKHTYWVESGPPTTLLETKESKEHEERKKKFLNSKNKSSPPSFDLEKSVTRKKIALPGKVEFEDIVTQQGPEPIYEGLAYAHFFPHGFTENTIIHLKDNSEHHASLVITPLIGRTELYERYMPSVEVFGK